MRAVPALEEFTAVNSQYLIDELLISLRPLINHYSVSDELRIQLIAAEQHLSKIPDKSASISERYDQLTERLASHLFATLSDDHLGRDHVWLLLDALGGLRALSIHLKTTALAQKIVHAFAAE